MPPTDRFGLIGQQVDNVYEVEQAMGEGGSSVVYRGTHLGLGEPIALKCLKLPKSLDSQSIETFTRRFRDEGRLLYRLGQGNLDIVRCIASGTTVSKSTGALIPFTVLEWLEGYSVSHDLRSRRRKGMNGRGLTELVTMFAPAALALEWAHKQGVVHRDVKPGNLFMQQHSDGHVRMKVLDFGLAKIMDDTIGMTIAATTGLFVMCSPRYAAPEQFSSAIGKIGTWTDVYSLALVLLEALRDRPVRESDDMAACMVVAMEPKLDLSARALGLKLPPRVEAALRRAVSYDPLERQASAGALWSEIVAGAKGASEVPRAASAPPSEPVAANDDQTVIDPRQPGPEAMVFTQPMDNAPGRRPQLAQEMPAMNATPVPMGAAYRPLTLASPSPPGGAGRQQPVRTERLANVASSPPPAVSSHRPPPPDPPPAAWSTPPPALSAPPLALAAPVTIPPAPPRAASMAPRRSGVSLGVVFLVLVVTVLVAGAASWGWRTWQLRQDTIHSP